MGRGPVPFPAVDRYLSRFLSHYTPDEVEEFMEYIDAMDDRYLEHFSKKETDSGDASPRNQGSGEPNPEGSIGAR